MILNQLKSWIAEHDNCTEAEIFKAMPSTTTEQLHKAINALEVQDFMLVRHSHKLVHGVYRMEKTYLARR